jgi:predicted nucleic acid-binding protein
VAYITKNYLDDALVTHQESGGILYDAVIAHAAFNAGAGVLLTWNVRDFIRIAPVGLEVMTPAEYAARASRLR